MKNKKIIFAIILFLLIGLTIFTFANPSSNEKTFDEEKTEIQDGDDNGTDDTTIIDEDNSESDITTNESNTNEVLNNVVGNQDRNVTIVRDQATVNAQNNDNYNNALAAVEKAEKTITQNDVEAARDLVENLEPGTNKDNLNDRLNQVQDIIDVSGLVATLEEKTTNSQSKEDILAAKKYRDNEQKIEERVESLKESKEKDDLKSRLNDLSSILDDNTPPEITGISSEFTKDDVTLEIKDSNNYTMEVMLDGKPYNGEMPFTEEGRYTVTVVDKAFNPSEVTFEIDKTLPKFEDLESKVKAPIAINVTEKNIDKITVTNKTTGETFEINSGDKLTVSGEYEIVASDKALNSNTLKITVDADAPELTLLEIFNFTNLNAKKNVKFANNDATIRIRAKFNEELSNDKLVVNIGGEKVGVAEKTKTGAYYADIKVADLLKSITLNNGDEIKFEIIGIEDTVGNKILGKDKKEGTITNSDILTTNDYDKVVYDNENPTVTITAKTKIDGSYENIDDLTNAGSIVYTFTWSEEVDGFTKDDISYTGFDHSESKTLTEIEKGKVYEIKLYTKKDTDIMTTVKVAANSVTDKAGNSNEEAEKSIKVDTLAPVISGVRLQKQSNDREEQKYAKLNDNIMITIWTEETLKENPKVVIGGNEFDVKPQGEGKEHKYVIYIPITEKMNLDKLVDENGYIVVTIKNVKDSLGNVADEYKTTGTGDYKVIYDNNPIKINSINVTVSGDDNTSNNTLAKENDIIQVKIDSSEEFSSLPVLNINNKNITFTLDNAQSNETSKVYLTSYTVNKSDDGVSEGAIVKYEITGLTDKAGNGVNYGDISNVTKLNQDNFNEIKYDITIPTIPYAFLNMYWVSNEITDESGMRKSYFKNGDSFSVGINFSEELKETPTLTIGGRKVELTRNSGETNAVQYVGTFNIPLNESELKEGLLEVILSNVVDIAGNIQKDETVLNQTNLNMRQAYYDNTTPTLTQLEILNITNFGSTPRKDAHYANDDARIRLIAVFDDEIVKDKIVVKINNKPVTISRNKMGVSGYYDIDIDMKNILNVTELTENEPIKFEISGLQDIAGNLVNGDGIVTNENIKTTAERGFDKVIYDKAPIIGGLESGATYFGKVTFTINDNSDYYTIYQGGNTSSCDELIAAGVGSRIVQKSGFGEFSNGYTYEITTDTTMSMCVVDSAQNQTFLNNINVRKTPEGSIEDLISNTSENSTIVLPEETILDGSKLNIKEGVTLKGSHGSKIQNGLIIEKDNITLKNVNIENKNSSLSIKGKNITIEGGSYTVKDGKDDGTQGNGAIRISNSCGVSIHGAILHGGIHLLDYECDTVDISGNNITLDYTGETELSGIVITPNNLLSFKTKAIDLYKNNEFSITAKNSYFVRIDDKTQNPWKAVDSVKVFE